MYQTKSYRIHHPGRKLLVVTHIPTTARDRSPPISPLKGYGCLCAVLAGMSPSRLAGLWSPACGLYLEPGAEANQGISALYLRGLECRVLDTGEEFSMSEVAQHLRCAARQTWTRFSLPFDT